MPHLHFNPIGHLSVNPPSEEGRGSDHGEGGVNARESGADSGPKLPPSVSKAQSATWRKRLLPASSGALPAEVAGSGRTGTMDPESLRRFAAVVATGAILGSSPVAHAARMTLRTHPELLNAVVGEGDQTLERELTDFARVQRPGLDGDADFLHAFGAGTLVELAEKAATALLFSGAPQSAAARELLEKWPALLDLPAGSGGLSVKQDLAGFEGRKLVYPGIAPDA